MEEYVMKIVVLGKGGREHALVDALARSASKPELFVWPGSAAMTNVAQPIVAKNQQELIDWMKDEGVDLCVPGAEQYLAEGIANACLEVGIPCWGPTREAAQLESSKLFAKEFLQRHRIPTGSFKEVAMPEAVWHAVKEFPAVLKYDGLAAGKGVAVCTNVEAVEQFIDAVFVHRKFGPGRVFVEEYLEGPELSIIAAVSGEQVELFVPARDYKRQLDDDQGPNTGGMGVVASRELVSEDVLETIREKIVLPTVRGLVTDGLPYCGFLYFGLMFTEKGPQVLEFNCRFGDPEAQAVLPLVAGDFATFLLQGATGALDASLLEVSAGWSIAIVQASKDYPISSGHGEVISGLDDVEDATVFHAGTRVERPGQYAVDGGRVLSVVAKGDTREEALERVYREVAKVHFDGVQYRSDIGRYHFEETIMSE